MELSIKSNIFDRRRHLIINSELVEFDDSDWKDVPVSQFFRGEITGIRFGIKPINGYMFTIGSKYCIDIKGQNEKAIEIKFTSLYGVRNKLLKEKYYQILETLFNTHQNDIVTNYLESYNNGVEVSLSGTIFSKSGISIKGTIIAWEDVRLGDYVSYYVISSIEQPTLYKSYNYLDDWNAAAIYSLTKHVLLKDKD